MAATPKSGAKVKWDTSQGETRGTVEKVVTGTTKVRSHTAKATKEKPELVVKNAKSGKKVVHKPDALKKG